MKLWQHITFTPQIEVQPSLILFYLILKKTNVIYSVFQLPIRNANMALEML